MNSPEQILKNIFGYSSFRSIQKEVITNVLNKNNTIAVMPTGGGKSLCYQIPALMHNGLTLVISPLISLMKDQLDQLHELGIPAGMLNSALSDELYSETVSEVKDGSLKLLYCAPETLFQQRTINLLRESSLSFIAVDEAHCISEWGHDFRPEYRRICEICNLFPNVTCIALTATATSQVRADISSLLNISSDSEFVAPFDRPNLFLDILPKVDPKQQAVEFISLFPEQAGIIYCFSRRQVEDLTKYLLKGGVNARAYHAGLSDKLREENQELFRRDDITVIVATIAFGMGINKPDIRFVLHFDLPQNIESYYQQIGRAGRDGLPAHCRTFFSHGDISKIQFFINQKSDTEKKISYNKLNDLLTYMESRECRRIPLLHYFSDNYDKQNCENCDNCVTPPPPENDYTVDAQKFLSCVMRMEQRYGVTLIIDILRGSKSAKVQQTGGNNISTYGIGSNHSKSEWMTLFRQMCSKGLLNVDREFGSLKITAAGIKVMKKEADFYGYITPATSTYRKKAGPEYGDRKLFEQLRSLRKKIAIEDGVPPYTVFPDKTLMEMSLFLPQTRDSLLMIHGVGLNKLERFGELFLNEINDYLNNNSVTLSPATSSSANDKERAYQRSARLFTEGLSVSALADQESVKASTIIDHLYRWVLEGNPLNTEALLDEFNISDELCLTAHPLFVKHGIKALKPVFEGADGAIDYEILKVLRIWYHAEKIQT
ncbi:MAG: DNA helicase RecQ [Spirochaetes bacterium]|jgi:ATP-dependent DNA helicase RecQ|nr:DNA helicase RecQ [Spirochaetota bacterium]